MLSVPAFARDGSAYAGIEGGILFPQDMKLNYDTNLNGTIDSTEVNNARFKHKNGYDVDAVIGYDFGRFRLEGEGAYKRAGLRSITSTGFDVDNGTAGVQTTANIGGHVNVKSIMANGLLDLGHDQGVSFYAGGGVGYGNAKLSDTVGAANPYYNDSHGGFAWQLIAGLRVPVSPGVDVGVKYRYFNLDKLHYNNFAGVRTDSEFRSHSLLASLLFNFGARSEPLPPPPPPAPAYSPPPPPPPPPAPSTRTCPDGTVVGLSDTCPVPPPPVVPRRGERG
jgi:opacity protein-like surface antigen